MLDRRVSTALSARLQTFIDMAQTKHLSSD